MSKAFTCLNCGACYGPIPVMVPELATILDALNQMPDEEVKRLARQKRVRFGCILRDMEHGRCAVYPARPMLCRMFGQYEGAECPNNPTATVYVREAGYARLAPLQHGEFAGVLSETILWPDLLAALKAVKEALAE